MIHKFANRLLTCSLLAVAALAATGCGSNPAPSADPAPKGEPLVKLFAAPKQSGSALWVANCNRCHNAAPPTAFTPPEWDMIVHHMRLRADITGQEARAIAEFLKSGS
jgi:cytochrome c5